MTKAWWKRFDWWLLMAMLVLLGMGLSMIASSTLGTDQPYFNNQLLFAGIGLLLYALVMRFPVMILIRLSPVLYGSTVGLLAVVAIFGKVTRGAASWLYLGPFALQPSEFAKLGLVLFLALLVIWREERGWPEWKFLGYAMAALLPPLGLTLIQPDMGSAMVIMVLWLAALWMSGLSWRVMGLLAASICVVGVVGWFGLEGYQKQRILTFLNPTSSPLGAGYNVLQSIIAVGSGQFFGRGWGRGTQSHLNFLPEHHTDFIFAMLSEEWVFVGALLVVVLYLVIVWRCVELLWWQQERSFIVLAAGLLAMLLFQASVNMAMNIGLAPVTGIPLPLVSYGGSSLITTLLSFAILEGLALQESPLNNYRVYSLRHPDILFNRKNTNKTT